MIGPAEIDALLARPKQLVGAPTWIADDRGSVTKLAAPAAESGIVGGLTLFASAPLHATPQRGSVVLVLEGRPIQRLSFQPDHVHVNPFAKSVPQPLRGLKLAAGQSRIHPWRLNRTWPRAPNDNVSVGEILDPQPETFGDALTIFLHACGIESQLPPPPWEPRLL